MSDESIKIFSDNLQRIMRTKGYTQADLADGIGVSRSIVSSWYNGQKMPRMDRAMDISDYLHVHISELYNPRGVKMVTEEYQVTETIKPPILYLNDSLIDELAEISKAYIKASDSIKDAVKKLLDVR